MIANRFKRPLLLVALAVGCEACACQRSPRSEGTSKADAGAPLLRRGDLVVVEARAAEFFEARVLGIVKDRVRVQPEAGDEPRSVAMSDLYPLGGARSSASPGAFAICRQATRWHACRQEPSKKGTFTTLDGVTLAPAAADVLAASELTQLNLREAFKKAENRLRFQSEANRAGEPEVPRGFRPLTHARVVARRAGGWYSATVEDVGEREVVIALSGGARERVGVGELVPEPPSPRQPSRGDFVLVRPLSPSEPWQVARVAAVTEREFRVAQPNADERVVGLRDVLLLVAEPP